MSHIFVETQSLRRYDERALGVLYRCIAYLRKKRLTRQEVLSIYEEGIEVVLSGHGLNHAPELNYALFYSKVRMRSPVVLTLKCLAARGESHAEVIQNGDPEKLIVAGTVRNRKFSGVSRPGFSDPEFCLDTIGPQASIVQPSSDSFNYQ
jgi:hypothetical protein